MERKKKASLKKKNVPKMKDLSAQQRRSALLKQKQCDAVALHIVRKLIDCPVEEDVFLQSLRYMNQCHYQDIVEERAIGKMCGYPICGNKILDMPTKKYHISTKLNKVYDITDRKNYCSNYCYKAGIYIKDQMLTSPLWFRDKEEIPDFHLLPRTETGVPGVEIDQGIAKVDVNVDEQFTSISKFAQDMLNDMPDEIDDNLIEKCKGKVKKPDIRIEKTIPKEEQAIKKVNTEKNIEQDKFLEPVVERQREATYFYANLYMPSLADILKENAEYFDKKTVESKGFDKTIINTTPNKILEKNETVRKIEILENKETEVKIDKRPKGFDRTIMNIIDDKKDEIYTQTEDNFDKVKGILSKGKTLKNKSKKMRVSFTEGHSEREYVKGEKIHEDNMNTVEKKFKKPVTADENNTKGIYKSVNVIGIVQERSNIYKLPIKTNNERTKSVDNTEVTKSTIAENILTETNMTPAINSTLVNNKEVTKSTITENVTAESNTKPEINTNILTNNENISSDLEKSVKDEKIIISDNKTNDKSVNTTVNIVNKEPHNKLENKNLESNEYKIQDTNATTDSNKKEDNNSRTIVENKQKRMSRLKNSSVYKKANNMSKPKAVNVKQTIEQQPSINIRLKKCLKQWLTVETMIFLYGEEHVKRILSEKSYKQYLNRKKNLELDELKQKQYDAICKRIHLMEMADRKFDESVTGKKSRPLPRYEDLKEQAETMDLKVRAFYSGFYEVFEEDAESETESVKDEEEEPYIVKGPPAVLPLVDSKDLMQTRKKIFLLSLRRPIPSVCEILKLCPHTIFSDLKKLIDTFEFDANNIVFKTAEWPVVALLLIQILSMQDKELQATLETEEGHLYITSFASQFNINAENIQEFIIKNSEIYNYLEDCVNKVNHIA